MNEILPGLFISGLAEARDRDQLLSYGVGAVVSCCTYQECPVLDEFHDFEYFRVGVEDLSHEPIHLFFEEAGQFIDDSLESQRPVLIHCRSGVSRSVTVLLSYLVWKHNFSLLDAFLHVLEKRPVICPNIGFMSQLTEWEEKKSEHQTSVCMFKYIDWYTADLDFRAQIPDLDP